MSYFISPPEETEWRIASATLTEHLRARWKDICIQDISNPVSNHAIEWNINMENGILHGSIDRAGQAIHLDSDVRNCAVFATWFRTLVPQEQPLLFFDEGYMVDISLDYLTTANQIVNIFLIS